MTNPNNATITMVHRVRFVDGHGLTIPTFRLLKDDGHLYADATAPELDKDRALAMYHSMVATRLLDERMLAAQRQGRISFYLQSLGEEAQAVASAAALAPQDMILAQYREQGALLHRGFTLDQFMNQLFSNADDLGKGRQMPVHYGCRELNFMTISSPLATQIPQATGFAYGQRLADEQSITLCYFGEGAASEGDFHAGLNMAAVLKTPVIFFCRNNGYAISTPASEQFVGDGIASRAVGYGIRTLRVDGADTLAVYEATRQARELMLKEPQPVLIEAMSYRLGAHSSSDDPSGYRSQQEEERWRKRDPIGRYRLWLQHQGWLNEEDDRRQTDALRRQILEAMKLAEQRPRPPLESIIEDVYASPPAYLERQLEQLERQTTVHPEHYSVGQGGGR
ncbi:thiamine pyrophosphate-dependent dehydrogenase E1 component subunit alpha [Oceanimonas sp. CHS3-5]|uniref:thiamine pyrophosphate-dependent dehydrogenase E1 component subunit alpha n=1 Tax=Oceanimonas sp. CHS3-5 TaxID=3068186 RepID=UPI00273EFA0F|nr:thiamine pyrophosphate-dependent dehydrogenase E1 component subunit alpha [Oceanimonas sp. CHS3-5]MDP5292723.1 thiamine pyrophosphate-dependent dehydrogenase E1 component subunit alpha [Oceanimonas sp. CHS3-5]